MTEFGVFVGNDPADLTGPAGFERWLGGAAEAVHAFTGSESWEAADPGWQISGNLGLTRRPIHWTLPAWPDGGGATAMDEASRGLYNATYDGWARKILAYHNEIGTDDGSPIYVRTTWELGGPWQPWTGLADAAPETYKQAFAQFASAFHLVSPRFKIVWDVVPNYGDVERWYPGNEFVDVIGQDLYWHDNVSPWGDTADAADRAFNKARYGVEVGTTRDPDDPKWFGLDWLEEFASNNGKQIAIPEWGVPGGDGSSVAGARWIEKFKDWLSDPALRGKVAYADYWNSSADYDGKLSDDDPSGTAVALKAMLRAAYVAHAATAGDDVLLGTDGADTLAGGAGADTLAGGAGADSLDGGAGNDVLLGGAGGAGNDTLAGGAGLDTADYSASALAVNLSYNAALAGFAGTDEQGGTDTLRDIETILGGAGNDAINAAVATTALRLDGGAGDDVLTGGAGSDTLDGGAGADTVSYASAASGVTASLADGTAKVGGVTDTLAGFEAVIGSRFDDVLTGGGGDDTLAGGAGSDTLAGGAGTDVADYSGSTTAVTVNLATGARSGDAALDTLTSIEGARGGSGDDSLTAGAANGKLEGGLGDDTLTGGAGDDTLAGGAGSDVLAGGIGNDTLEGGAGNDALDGGAGLDTASYASAAAGVSISLAITTTGQNTGGAGTDTLSGFEALVGSGFNDTLAGGAGNDTLEGGGGNDALTGGAGLDTASYASATNGVSVSLALAGAQNTLGAGTDTLSGFEALVGSGFNDTLAGGMGADALLGREGADTLIGGAGADSMDGGAGADTASYAGSAAGVVVDLTGGTASGGDGAGDVLSGIENAAGSAFDDFLYGTAGANLLAGGAGRDTLAGVAGQDTLDGGDGFDTADFRYAAAAVSADLASGVEARSGSSLVSVEAAVGSAHADALSGDAAANWLDGREGADALLGREGDDTLIGGAGADSMDGGADADMLFGGADGDTLAGGTGADSMMGGDDNDRLNGGAGADLLDGGAGGRDVASYIGSTAVAVDLALGADPQSGGWAAGDVLSGIEDLVGSAGADTLAGDAGANVLWGQDGADRLEGRAGNDTLLGESGSDTLSGGDGSDTLDGGIGGDSLDGGAGGDTFRYAALSDSAAATPDIVARFSSADSDRIDLSRIDPNAAMAGDQAFAFLEVNGAAFSGGGVAQVRFRQSGTDTFVEADTGDGVADLVVRVQGLVAFTAADFLL